MFSFCPHCGQTLTQKQVEGAAVACEYCKKPIGVVAITRREAVNEADELIRGGTAARCAACQQVVALKSATARTLVPHYAAGTRKICPGSGKPAPPPSPLRGRGAGGEGAVPVPEPASVDKVTGMNSDVIKGISLQQGGEPRIEVLTLSYLDKRDRVRIQIDALREMLGPNFRMSEYPAALKRPHLTMWTTGTACFVAAKHPGGGCQSIGDGEVAAVIAEMRDKAALFLTAVGDGSRSPSASG